MSDRKPIKDFFEDASYVWPSDADFRDFSTPLEGEVDVFGNPANTDLTIIVRQLRDGTRGVQCLAPILPEIDTEKCAQCGATICEVRIGGKQFYVDVESRGSWRCANLISRHECDESENAAA